MRICVVAPALPPAVGGAEVVADSIIRALLRTGVEVDVVSGVESAAVRDAVTGAGGRYLHIGRNVPPDAIAWEFDTFARAQSLWVFFLDRQPDLVHVFSHDAAVSVEMASPQAPVVGTFSEMATEEAGFGACRSRFVYRLPVLSLVTASSDYYAALPARHGFPASRVRRVVTGVDLDRFGSGSAARGMTALGLDGDGQVVLCPSRFTPRKGQLDLVEAVGLVRDHAFRVLLLGSVHSGSVKYLRAVEERIEQLGLGDRVHVVPGLAHDDMADAYAACDIVVQPSHGEGLGLSALEALAAGKPLLATEVSSFDRFLVHEENALVVPPGDPAALAGQLTRLLNDRALRDRLTDRGRADLIRDFGVERTVEELMAVYREAVDGSAASP